MDNNAYTYRAVREAEAPSFLAGVKILTKRKFFFVAIVMIAWGGAIFIHKKFPRYVSSSEVFVRSSANSLVTTIGGAAAAGPSMGFGPEKNPLEKYLNYFETYQYSKELAKELLRFTSTAAPQILKAELSTGDPRELLSPEMRTTLKLFLADQIEGRSPSIITDGQSPVEVKEVVLIEFLREAIDVYESKKDTIQARVIAPNKSLSVHLSNFILSTISESIKNYDIQELVDTKNYLEAQIKTMKVELETVQEQFISFLSNSLKNDPNFNPSGIVDTSGLRKILEGAIIELKQNRTMIEKIREQKVDSPTNKYPPHLVNILKQNSEALRIRKNKLLLLGVTADSRQIKSLDEQIIQTDQKLIEAEAQWGKTDTSPPTQDSSPEQTFSRTIATLQSENRALNARIESVQVLLTQSSAEGAKATESKQRVDEFSRKIAFNYILAENLQKKLVDIEIQKVSINSKVKVIETANLQQVKHKVAATGKLLVATVLALLFGILFSYVSELFDTTIKSRHDLIDIGLTVLGTLPATNLKKTKQAAFSAKNAGLTYNHETLEEMALKQIRSRLIRLKRRDRKDVQVFSVLSSIPGEGKSYFATNMARVLAQLGYPTLFIDSDVRRPSAPLSLGFTNKVGMTQILSQGLPWKSAVQRLEKHKLDVIASGPMDDHVSEAFASDKFKELLVELKSHYRFVVIDCPPVLPVADGLSIASFTDANFLVCSVHLSNKGEVAEALMRLSAQTSEPVHGILNRVEDHNRSKYSHMYLARSHEQVQKQQAIKDAIHGDNHGLQQVTTTSQLQPVTQTVVHTPVRAFPRRPRAEVQPPSSPIPPPFMNGTPGKSSLPPPFKGPQKGLDKKYG